MSSLRWCPRRRRGGCGRAASSRRRPCSRRRRSAAREPVGGGARWRRLTGAAPRWRTRGWRTARRRTARATGSRTAGAHHRRRRRLPTQHDRQAGLGLNEQPRREIRRAFHVDHIGLALRRFGLADIRIGHRESRASCRRTCRAAIARSPASIASGAARNCASIIPGGGAGAPGRGGGGTGRGISTSSIADESGRSGAGVLRGKFIAPRIFVGQLGLDLELDRDQVLAAHLARAAGGDEGLDAGDLRVAAEGGPGGRQPASALRAESRGGPVQTRSTRATPRQITRPANETSELATNRRIGAGSLGRSEYLDPANPETVVGPLRTT